MSVREFCEWSAYVDAFGPVDYRRRYDEPAALVSYVTQRVQGGKGKYEDMLPKYNRPDYSDVDMQVMKALGNKK